jgi:fatty-acyl-CoA synthase
MTEACSPIRQPLWHLLEQVAQQHPHAEALVDETRRLTYAGLVEEANQVARALLALGLRRGDHIGLLRGNSVTWAVHWYAAASLGLVSVPMNTRFRVEELSYGLAHEDIKALLCVDRFLEKIDFIAMLREIEPALDSQLPGTALPLLQHLVVDGEQVPAAALSMASFIAAGQRISDTDLAQARAAVAPDDTLLIQLTSGTTSYPKGVMLSHAAMLGVADAVAERLGVKADDRYYSPRPFYHVSGSTMSLLVALVKGACLVTARTFDPKLALQAMADERCTLTSGNDTMFLMMLAEPSFDPARLCLRGGWAAASPAILREVVERMGAYGICNAYGLSEAGPNLVVSAADEPLEQRIDGYMLPHAGIELEIRDPATGQALAAGEVGEICARGWSLMKGYYKLPEKTAEALRDGWLHTGDLGQLDARGRLQFVGRLKDMFRVGGENVSPLEVEQVLLKHPAVALAQVVGVPDPRLGEVPAAYVTLRDGQQVSADDIIAFCKARSANFKVPRYLSVVDDFESIGMTGSNKVQKNKLREHAIVAFGLNP